MTQGATQGPSARTPKRGSGRNAYATPSRLSRAIAFCLDVLRAVVKVATKDPLSTFLLAASIGLTILFFSMLDSIGPSSPGRQVPLSAVINAADDKKLQDVLLLDVDSRVVARTKDGRQAWASYPSSDAQIPDLLRRLSRSGTIVAVDQQSSKPEKQIVVQFLLPILILVCLFGFFMRVGQDDMAGGFSAFSKIGGKRRKGKGLSRTTFANVAGAGEAVTELREIRDYLADPTKYDEMGAHAPRGVLLVGPPGTGKTLLARATAGEAAASFYSLSGSEFVESLVGVGAARVRDLFAQARKTAPAIIFIDELDAAGRRRGAGIGQGNDEREQTLNQILVEMDGFDAESGIVVMGATNRPDILDPALLRPGRFDRQVTIDVPDVHGREEILKLHCGNRPLAAGASLAEIAKLTPGIQRRRARERDQRSGAAGGSGGVALPSRSRSWRRRSTASSPGPRRRVTS